MPESAENTATSSKAQAGQRESMGWSLGKERVIVCRDRGNAVWGMNAINGKTGLEGSARSSLARPEGAL